MRLLVSTRRPILYLLISSLLLLFSLASCGPIVVVTRDNNPFNEKKALVHVGTSTRVNVHSVLGEPCWQNIKNNVEVFGVWGSQEKLCLLAPKSCGTYWWSYYLIVNYDNDNRVVSILDASEKELDPDIKCKIPETE